ncbi:HIG1 domain family member 1A, mitochondrial-like [Antedon mediterranea]|uniref:HIG1 domain family member 1A, mitochondrial-like n=1 Tax=Antedon mediterranea TaxID=105859 RepID=UPI003AF7B1DA
MMSDSKVNSPVEFSAGDIYRQETPTEKFARKSKQDPFVPIGIAGLAVSLGYGAYAYRSRRGMSTSIYLMRLRVIAQTAVVGAMICGVGYSLVSSTLKKDE